MDVPVMADTASSYDSDHEGGSNAIKGLSTAATSSSALSNEDTKFQNAISAWRSTCLEFFSSIESWLI